MIITNKKHFVAQKGAAFIEKAREGVFIMGANKYGSNAKSLLRTLSIPVLGFINDYREDLSFEDTPVLLSNEVPQNQSLINCVIEGRAIDAQKKLIELYPKQVSTYFDLQAAFPSYLPEVDFLNNTDSITNDLDLYKELYEKLNDEESKQTLFHLLRFRLNRDIKDLERFQFRIKEQYFEPFIKLGDKPVFIDGGGFDGATSLYFATLYPDYSSIYYFEPNQEIIPTAKENLKDVANLFFYEKGLWSTSTTLSFDNTLSSASKLTSNGNIIIPTVSLDEVVAGKVDFIKLDIEGAEFEAIKGAREIITQQKPMVAVCVYHDQQDFLRIPALLSEYRNDYKIYLRHYTQGVFETVMYFV
jgi:FkbM family methyltransferase